MQAVQVESLVRELDPTCHTKIPHSQVNFKKYLLKARMKEGKRSKGGRNKNALYTFTSIPTGGFLDITNL